ncbi:uncharacterized protein LOC129741875 [Uranotaenia lowii]|uniref:uncharacterized protein LOC129741875 n=1 Tax=Uranotaenia lowii TaxID=190385 RepID=UPI00247B2889|nr:uncharacterized protein LOC129741875 [Uranotaenia lowii]
MLRSIAVLVVFIAVVLNICLCQAPDATNPNGANPNPPPAPANNGAGTNANNPAQPTQSGKSPPKIDDQTDEIFTETTTVFNGIKDLLVTVGNDFQASLAQSLKNISARVSPKTGTVQLLAEVNNTRLNDQITATIKRLSTSVIPITVKSLNNTIEKFVKVEQAGLSKLKLSSEAGKAGLSLQQIENAFYANLSDCLKHFKATLQSDVMTAHNILLTYFVDLDDAVDSFEKVTCSANTCNRITTSMKNKAANWRNLFNVATNSIGNINELVRCSETQYITANNLLNQVLRTISPQPDIRAIVTGDSTAKVKVPVANALTSFSQNVQKLAAPVLDALSLMGTFVSLQPANNPKTILQNAVDAINKFENSLVSSFESFVTATITSATKSLATLWNTETLLIRRISAAIDKDVDQNGLCDTAVDSLETTKRTFNTSVVECYNTAVSNLNGLLTTATSTVGTTWSSLKTLIAKVDDFDCEKGCTAEQRNTFVEQLKKDVTTALAPLTPSDLKPSKNAFDTCFAKAIEQATKGLDQKANANIKACLDG